MKIDASNELIADVPNSPSAISPGALDQYFLHLDLGRAVSWSSSTISAFGALILFWAYRMYSTWAIWGNLSIDSGREMYVPSVLLQGKMLYRDVWYLYGPAAPYFNSYLYKAFGTRMEVLYWAGSLAALVSAILLFIAGMRLSSWTAGCTAGAVVLMQSFQPGLFSFPLAYSFSSVYGCVAACSFVYFVIRASNSAHWGWVFGAATTAAVALLMKLEYGAACYPILFLLIAARYLQYRSWKTTALDFVMTIPGLVVCAIVIHWMISIAGVNFITQENLMSWPTAYFMKTFGKMWLENSGLVLNSLAFSQALVRAAFYTGVVLEAYCLLWWRRWDARSIYMRAGLLLIIITYFGFYLGFKLQVLLTSIFFPQDMVLYVAAAALAACWHFCRHPGSDGSLGLSMVLLFSALLAFRILLKTTASGYAIYYDGPVVLSFLVLATSLVPRSGRSQRFIAMAQVVLCLGCFLAVFLASPRADAKTWGLVPLTTERGTILVQKRVAANYQAAIPFILGAAAQGDLVLSIPEDTSLYFLSGVDCPLRVFAFTPGIVAPGKMEDEIIRELEQKPVRYLLWSNRTFSEYGVAGFGMDFNQKLGNYLKSHYHSNGLLIPPGSGADFQRLTFVVWERNSTQTVR